MESSELLIEGKVSDLPWISRGVSGLVAKVSDSVALIRILQSFWGRMMITSALCYIHSHRVLQVDIGAHNVLLDWDDNVKLADFAGASLDGSEPQILCGIRAEHPAFPSSERPTVKTEIFSLGSLLYELETTRQPYHDKTDDEVEMLYCAGNFPDTGDLLLGQVITKCWMMEYKDAGDVLNDIKCIKGRSTVQMRKSHFILVLSLALVIYLARVRSLPRL
ncbi:hypothetical protein AJ80_08963 [Polytolypa hystricis UAMH7299]|uniref:Protein kinase domain-containing protein n=1 Tax=Polytolypa hystricis (strain UAMH7299) TaxID=1447883 RepID=A0A2B7WYB4_POLH7|nr:hypothetical protein AJ80_08963 [Polytolypa hystricis UAMH7299]